MISLRYEIEGNNCISVVDGRDRCQAPNNNWLGLAAAVGFIVATSLLESIMVRRK